MIFASTRAGSENEKDNRSTSGSVNAVTLTGSNLFSQAGKEVALVGGMLLAGYEESLPRHHAAILIDWTKKMLPSDRLFIRGADLLHD